MSAARLFRGAAELVLIAGLVMLLAVGVVLGAIPLAIVYWWAKRHEVPAVRRGGW